MNEIIDLLLVRFLTFSVIEALQLNLFAMTACLNKRKNENNVLYSNLFGLLFSKQVHDHQPGKDTRSTIGFGHILFSTVALP
jgi:hypothetical protein